MQVGSLPAQPFLYKPGPNALTRSGTIHRKPHRPGEGYNPSPAPACRFRSVLVITCPYLTFPIALKGIKDEANDRNEKMWALRPVRHLARPAWGVLLRAPLPREDELRL